MSKVPKVDEYRLSNEALQRGIGILGLALPIVLVFFEALDGSLGLMPTLSDYYYRPVLSGFFVGILWSIGVFLILYKGYATVPKPYVTALPGPLARWMTDAHLSSIAGTAAIVTAMVPTCDAPRCDALSFASLHLGAAGLCLGTLAALSIWTFTASDTPSDHQTAHKRTSNRIHRLCGWLIIASLGLISALFAFGPDDLGPTIFGLESAAIAAFATSWLRKSLADPADRSAPDPEPRPDVNR